MNAPRNGMTLERILARACVVAPALVAFLPGSTTRAQHPGGHGAHPPMPDQRLVLVCRWEDSTAPPANTIKFDLAYTGSEEEFSRGFDIPKSQTVIRPLRYIAQAVLEQRVIEDDGDRARPGVELSLEGPTQSFRRWLIADDPERNRLMSFIGTWRLMAVNNRTDRDELFRQFETELTRDPKLIVSRTDGEGAQEIGLSVGSAQPLPELETTVRVLRFFPDYAIESSTEQPVNRSEQRRNPAALVELAHQGKTEERWVFAKFPDFGPKDATRLPIRIALDCSVLGSEKVPDFCIIAIGDKEWQVWSRFEGKTRSRSLSLREPVEVAESQYRFQAVSFVPKGRMIEEYQPAASGRGVPAMQFEATDGPNPSTRFWLELGETKTLPRTPSPLSVSLQTESKSKPGAHP